MYITKQKLVAAAGTAIVVASLVLPSLAFAQSKPDLNTNPFDRGAKTLQKTASGAGIQNGDLYVIVGNFINIFLGLLGIIFLVLALYAGYLWMTAGGEEDQIEKAKDLIKNAVIGVVIIMASYALSTFVIDQLRSATGQ